MVSILCELEVPVGPAFGDNSDFPRRNYRRATPDVETLFLTALLDYSTVYCTDFLASNGRG
jgi:hypothetical protein